MSQTQNQQQRSNNNSRRNYRDNVNNRLRELLEKYKNDVESLDNIMKELTFREKIPDVPYFRKTKSGAIACHGVKREAIVLYRDQWLKLSKVFQGGKRCNFNNFFYNMRNSSGHRRVHQTREESRETQEEESPETQETVSED